MVQTDIDSAFYFSEFLKTDTVYIKNTYWSKSKKIYASTVYVDTAFKKEIGLSRSFYENGQISDSTYYFKPTTRKYSYHFFENGQIKDSIFYRENFYVDSAYHYYKNGDLYVHYVYNIDKSKEIMDAYEQNGSKIDNFIYLREAEFKGGNEAWKRFLEKNLKSDVPSKNGARKGTYLVVIRFVIDKEGFASSIKAETNFGYGMEEEVIRVIKKSEKWRPAIYLGKQVNAYRRQPITFVVDY